MQIRHPEAMQAMAKSANSKVIFLPAANQTMGNSAAFNAALKNADTYNPDEGESSAFREFGGHDPAFQQAMGARMVENI